MKIKTWGVRGSLPAPLTNKQYKSRLLEILQEARLEKLNKSKDILAFINELPNHLRSIVGGNTTCISVTSQSGQLYILDAGSGIRELGNTLMKGDASKGTAKISILLTHTHWDHIQGLPFFTPMYIPGNEITFYSPYPDLKERLIRQQDKEYFFPIPFEATASTKKFITLEKDSPFELEQGLFLRFHALKHPGQSYAYRFDENKKSFLFLTDVEFIGEDIESENYKHDFFNNIDFCIMDSQYTLDESFFKLYWGHTSITMAVNMAQSWGVKNLMLTHHEPTYDDKKLWENLNEAKMHLKLLNCKYPKIYLAQEGKTIKL